MRCQPLNQPEDDIIAMLQIMRPAPLITLITLLISAHISGISSYRDTWAELLNNQIPQRAEVTCYKLQVPHNLSWSPERNILQWNVATRDRIIIVLMSKKIVNYQSPGHQTQNLSSIHISQDHPLLWLLTAVSKYTKKLFCKICNILLSGLWWPHALHYLFSSSLQLHQQSEQPQEEIVLII